MTWRHYLKVKTREPRFLWRMSLGILAVGIVVGVAVDAMVPSWIDVENLPERSSLEDSPWSGIKQLAGESKWSAVWWGIPRLLVARWMRTPGLTILAVMTGAAWMAFLLQSIQIRSWSDVRLAAPLMGVCLGAVSVWPTFFFILWQEYAWELEETSDLAGGLRYFILGVGLREELSKLLLFLPLLPVLLWRRDELAALITAGCVGIGFGMEENVGYIGSSLGRGTLSRLMMPMPFHMTLTGLTGLALYRACRWPREWAPQFVAIFGVMVLAHGLYDSFLVVPLLSEYNFAAFIIFLLLVYQFFRELRPLQSTRHEMVSLTANFLACVTLVAAANFVYLSAAMGWREAFDVLMQGIIAEAIMVYLFLREMPERLA